MGEAASPGGGGAAPHGLSWAPFPGAAILVFSMAPAWAPGSGGSPCSAGLSPILALRGPQDGWGRAGGRCRGAGLLTLLPARGRGTCALTAAIISLSTMTPGLSGPAASTALGAGYGQQEPPGVGGLVPPRSSASGGEEGVTKRQECLPPEQGEGEERVFR